MTTPSSFFFSGIKFPLELKTCETRIVGRLSFKFIKFIIQIISWCVLYIGVAVSKINRTLSQYVAIFSNILAARLRLLSSLCSTLCASSIINNVSLNSFCTVFIFLFLVFNTCSLSSVSFKFSRSISLPNLASMILANLRYPTNS